MKVPKHFSTRETVTFFLIYFLVFKSEVTINIFSSIYAGGLTAIATSPIWVVRTRMMTQFANTGYQTITHAFQEIYKKEGIRGEFFFLIFKDFIMD
jgi:hypothetical protein